MSAIFRGSCGVGGIDSERGDFADKDTEDHRSLDKPGTKEALDDRSIDNVNDVKKDALEGMFEEDVQSHKIESTVPAADGNVTGRAKDGRPDTVKKYWRCSNNFFNDMLFYFDFLNQF